MNDEKQIILEYILRNLKNSGIPTYSDTPGMGNVAPWQIGRGRFAEDKPEDQWINQNMAKQGPGSYGPQRFDLEKWLLEQHLRQTQQSQQQRQPQYQPPEFGHQGNFDEDPLYRYMNKFNSVPGGRRM